MAVVSDTTTLNYLVQIGLAEILHTLFGNVFVPRAVVAELTVDEAPEAVRAWMSSPPPWILVEDVEVPSEAELLRLELGEREAIVLAEYRGLPLLIDERIGRGVARRRGIAISGTLGALDEAADRGLLDFKDALSKLRQTSRSAYSRAVPARSGRATATVTGSTTRRISCLRTPVSRQYRPTPSESPRGAWSPRTSTGTRGPTSPRRITGSAPSPSSSTGATAPSRTPRATPWKKSQAL
jgi:predicted nucleic acid-binding protein